MITCPAQSYHEIEKYEIPIRQALQFLAEHDLRDTEPGRVEIDGDAMFAVVQAYHTDEAAGLSYERHNVYIALHFMLSGQEKILVCNHAHVVAVYVPYDAAGDIVFYEDPQKEAAAELCICAGEYAVFFPEDCHKTRCNLQAGVCENVKKVIVKIKV